MRTSRSRLLYVRINPNKSKWSYIQWHVSRRSLILMGRKATIEETCRIKSRFIRWTSIISLVNNRLNRMTKQNLANVLWHRFGLTRMVLFQVRGRRSPLQILQVRIGLISCVLACSSRGRTTCIIVTESRGKWWD